MAKIEKKEEVKPLETAKVETNVKQPKKTNMQLIAGLILLLCCAGSITYNIELTKTLNEDLAAQLTTDYNQKINNLKKQLHQQETLIHQLQQPIQPTLSETSLLSEENLQQIAAKIMPLLPQSEKVSDNISATTDNVSTTVTTPEVLLAAGALTVKGLAEDGLPFDYEAEVLQILAEGNTTALNYISSLKKYAVSGLKGRAMLISEFNKVYADLSRPQTNKTPQTNISETWDEALLRKFKELIVLKKRENKPVLAFPKTPDEIHQLVNNGDFAEALNKIQTDRKYGDINSAELNAWILQTRNYLEFEHSINGLIMNSLANLHLKEMERTK